MKCFRMPYRCNGTYCYILLENNILIPEVMLVFVIAVKMLMA